MIKSKPVKERDNLDLIELVFQLHGRSIQFPSKEMHDAYVEARTELEKRASQFPSQGLKLAAQLAEAYEEYIKVLQDELNDTVGMASIHGWQSRNVKRGEDARYKLGKIKLQILENESAPSQGLREEDWKTALRRMRDNDEFDDKFNTKTLEFIYAFQMGFKANVSTPDGSQGLREALELVDELCEKYPCALAETLKPIATEALKK